MKPKATFLLWFLLIHSGAVFSLEHVPTRHYEEFFTLPGDERIFARHVIIPVDNSTGDSPESRTLLAILAGEIRRDAQEKGYLSGPSKKAYQEELELLEKGYWPVTYITVAGEWQALIHLAFAIRWEDSKLPWENRFLGDDTNVLPKNITSTHKPVLGSFSFAKFSELTELNSPSNQWQLNLLALMRMEMAGERAEFKFLGGREPSFLLMRELFHASTEYQLHKYSRRSFDRTELLAAEESIRRREYTGPCIRSTARLIDSPHTLELISFFENSLLDPNLQQSVTNSTVCGHVSDRPVGPLWQSPRYRLFERMLALPPSFYSFIEGPGCGTIGIRTDIPIVTTSYFETHILRSLDEVTGLKERPAHYLNQNESPKHIKPLSCSRFISDFEKAMLLFIDSKI